MSKKGTVYIISGPTTSGKSDIAFYLAKLINGEIVNCDSIQLYQYLDIGSAKPPIEQMQQVRHHLYSVVKPDYKMTVATYREAALAVIDNILQRGKTPIVVGGTGLYINSILYDMEFPPKFEDEERRHELEEMAEKLGNKYMYDYLEGLDPEAASRLHPNNIRKVIRAIEAYEMGSQIKSLSDCNINPDYDFRFYALNMDREWLYDRINKRVIKMIKSGLVKEVKELQSMGITADTPSMKAIGYKEVFRLLDRKITAEEMIVEIMKNSRHYAKRQITWLKRYEGIVNWIDISKSDTYKSILDQIIK